MIRQERLNSTDDDDGKDIREAFDIVDKAHFGKINTQQLLILIQILGYNPPEDFFQEKDQTEESQHSFDDVMKIINTKNQTKSF